MPKRLYLFRQSEIHIEAKIVIIIIICTITMKIALEGRNFRSDFHKKKMKLEKKTLSISYIEIAESMKLSLSFDINFIPINRQNEPENEKTD